MHSQDLNSNEKIVFNQNIDINFLHIAEGVEALYVERHK